MEVFEISKEDFPDGAVCVNVAGRIDHETVKRLERVLDKLTGEKQFKIVLGLSGVPYIGSAGVGVLLDVSHLLGKNGGMLVLAGAQSPVRQIFDGLGVTPILTFTDDIPSALKTLGQPGSQGTRAE